MSLDTVSGKQLHQVPRLLKIRMRQNSEDLVRKERWYVCTLMGRHQGVMIKEEACADGLEDIHEEADLRQAKGLVPLSLKTRCPEGKVLQCFVKSSPSHSLSIPYQSHLPQGWRVAWWEGSISQNQVTRGKPGNRGEGRSISTTEPCDHREQVTDRNVVNATWPGLWGDVYRRRHSTYRRSLETRS